MPIYLCKPGRWASEPWRHGIQVYSRPFDISTAQEEDAKTSESIESNPNAGADPSIRDTEQRLERDPPPTETNSVARDQIDRTDLETDTGYIVETTDAAQSVERTTIKPAAPKPVRRIRHGEVVLVDDVCFLFGNYWLRLRWPGARGGFAGYICLISSSVTNETSRNVSKPNVLEEEAERDLSETISLDHQPDTQLSEENLELELPEPTEANTESFIPVELTEESRAPSAGFYAANSDDQTMRCLRTGIVFPSSPTLQLLQAYDDGLVPPVAIPSEGNPVFCRICRENLHDEDENNHKEGENPLMAPCDCAGSMAFVHYLCVEQWRCRSTHPEARNGLNCETCSKPYALPPPTSRPVVEEEWLDAMPPHVMQALRQPHIGWQIGAFLVRKRWLRPIAPIVFSPIVALYCRARRLLKKRGVSRRRWACSLCRRRARWKCVRCLRSYYCSRQCQNVSWHIVHKHVCYKPARFWWSVVVYTGLTLFYFPGILKDPLLYDLLMSIVPASFYIMAVLGGSTATTLKKAFGIDLRGRVMESIVVLLTSWLVWVTWGLVWGFFGEPERCVGVFGGSSPSKLTDFLNVALLKNADSYFKFWERLAITHSFSRKWICNAEEHCFSHVPNVSPDHLLDNPKCTSDLQSVFLVWIGAVLALIVSTVLRRRRRNHVRPHQD